jgi:hypothetical protein
LNRRNVTGERGDASNLVTVPEVATSGRFEPASAAAMVWIAARSV